MKIEELPEWARTQVTGHEDQVYVDERGTLRYRENPLMRWIADRFSDVHDYHWMQRREDAVCPTLNSMAAAFQQGAFGVEDYMQFYRDIGYSLSGFEEVFGEELDRRECGQGAKYERE